MTTAAPPRETQTVYYNTWAEPLYHHPSPYDYRIVPGGRGSSKTHEISQALTALGHMQPLRIVIAREHLKSINESAKVEVEMRIREMGLERPDCYGITENRIQHAIGTRFFFIGLSKMSEADIKGLAQVDIVWVEEAQRMSESSWNLLYPTIRKEHSEIWVSFNPEYRYQIAWKLFQENLNNPRWWVRQVSWRDNEFFTDRNERDRVADKENRSEAYYRHVWEGVPDDEGAERKVLPYGLLEKCVEAWDRRPERGAFGTGGFDVADTGADSNALALRSGPELFHVELWQGSESFTIVESTKKVCSTIYEHGVQRVDYDAGGVGSGCRGVFRDWMRDNSSKPIYANGCAFGGSVQGGDVIFERRRPRSILNNQYFHNFGSQAGFVLRQRADNTVRLLKGEDVDPHKCLMINPDIPRLDVMLADMSQAVWDDSSGKYRIDKQPRGPGEPLPPSPDAFDAIRLAFSYDARYGLRQSA